MKQLIVGIASLILGFFALVFAGILGLCIGLVAFITKPFIRAKLRKMEQEMAQAAPAASGETIDAEFQDITANRAKTDSATNLIDAKKE